MGTKEKYGNKCPIALNVRLTPSIHRRIAMLALQADQSINAYIKEALEKKVEASMAIVTAPHIQTLKFLVISLEVAGNYCIFVVLIKKTNQEKKRNE